MGDIFAKLIACGLSFLVYEEADEPMAGTENANGPIRIFIGTRPFPKHQFIMASGKTLSDAVADAETITDETIDDLVNQRLKV